MHSHVPKQRGTACHPGKVVTVVGPLAQTRARISSPASALRPLPLGAWPDTSGLPSVPRLLATAVRIRQDSLFSVLPAGGGWEYLIEWQFFS